MFIQSFKFGDPFALYQSMRIKDGLLKQPQQMANTARELMQMELCNKKVSPETYTKCARCYIKISKICSGTQKNAQDHSFKY